MNLTAASGDRRLLPRSSAGARYRPGFVRTADGKGTVWFAVTCLVCRDLVNLQTLPSECESSCSPVIEVWLRCAGRKQAFAVQGGGKPPHSREACGFGRPKVPGVRRLGAALLWKEQLPAFPPLPDGRGTVGSAPGNPVRDRKLLSLGTLEPSTWNLQPLQPSTRNLQP